MSEPETPPPGEGEGTSTEAQAEDAEVSRRSTVGEVGDERQTDFDVGAA